MQKIKRGHYLYKGYMICKRVGLSGVTWALCTSFDIDKDEQGMPMSWLHSSETSSRSHYRELRLQYPGMDTWFSAQARQRYGVEYHIDCIERGDYIPIYSDADMYYLKSHLDEVPRLLCLYPSSKQLQSLLS